MEAEQADQYRQQAAQEQAAQQAAQRIPAQASAGGTQDMIAQLQKLADLKDRGILTDEEFATQKARILG